MPTWWGIGGGFYPGRTFSGGVPTAWGAVQQTPATFLHEKRRQKDEEVKRNSHKARALRTNTKNRQPEAQELSGRTVVTAVVEYLSRNKWTTVFLLALLLLLFLPTQPVNR